MVSEHRRKNPTEGSRLPGSRRYVSDIWGIEKPVSSWPKGKRD